MVRDAGNRFSEALNVRLRRDGTRTLTNSLSSPDDQLDFYNVRLTRRSNLRVLLNGLAEDADLTLYDSDQVELRASEEDDEDAEVINLQLSAGDYFVRVNQIEDSTNYRIRFAVSPDAGNTFKGARRIRLQPDQQRGRFTFNDTVGGSLDREDYYRFELAEQSTIEAVLDGLNANVDLRLFNGRGRQIGISNRIGSRSETIENTLSPGVYFLKANPRNLRQQETSYRLRFSFAPASATASLTKSGAALFY